MYIDVKNRSTEVNLHKNNPFELLQKDVSLSHEYWTVEKQERERERSRKPNVLTSPEKFFILFLFKSPMFMLKQGTYIMYYHFRPESDISSVFITYKMGNSLNSREWVEVGKVQRLQIILCVM